MSNGPIQTVSSLFNGVDSSEDFPNYIEPVYETDKLFNYRPTEENKFKVIFDRTERIK